jgi:hypothetical protein
MLLMGGIELESGTARMRFTLRPKIAGAPFDENSVRADHGIKTGTRLLLMEVDPPANSMDDGITILPLICSEYFERNGETRQTLVRALETQGLNELNHRDAVDLLAVVNVCKRGKTTTSWPSEFEGAMAQLHGEAGCLVRTRDAVTTLTCPQLYAFEGLGPVGGAASGAVLPVRFWAPRDWIEPPAGGRVVVRAHDRSYALDRAKRSFQLKDAGIRAASGEALSVHNSSQADGRAEVAAGPLQSSGAGRDNDLLLVIGLDPDLKSRGTSDLLCYDLSIPRLQRGRDSRRPITGAEILTLIADELVPIQDGLAARGVH